MLGGRRDKCAVCLSRWRDWKRPAIPRGDVDRLGGNDMKIRRATEADLPTMMTIYAAARRFMAEHGNPNQWGPTNWPPESLLRSDIADGASYLCCCGRKVVGTFVFRIGPDIEPTYREIQGGNWLDHSPYGVVHRLASDGSAKGVGHACIEWAFARCPHLRIDTHPDNLIMQRLLEKTGFKRRSSVRRATNGTRRRTSSATHSARSARQRCSCRATEMNRGTVAVFRHK